MLRGSADDGRTFATQTVGTRPQRKAISKKASERKYRYLRSRFIILVNTNIDFDKHQNLPFDETIDTLERAMNDLINQSNELVKANILKCYSFNPDDPTSLGTLLIPTPPNPYQHGKLYQAFETSTSSNYLHQHVDLTLDHTYGENAIALQLDRKALYQYLAQRLLKSTKLDFFKDRRLFIRIKRVPANMAKSYLAKSIEQTEYDARQWNKEQLSTVPWLSARSAEALMQADS